MPTTSELGIPFKTSQTTNQQSPPVFKSHNRFKALSPGTARHNKQPAGTMSSNTMPTSNETTRPFAPKILSNTTESLIVNLSKQSLTETEKSVLELDLTFCPSEKDLNKEQLALDLFNFFIRRLKLREHFFHNPSQPQSTGDGDKTANQEDERSNLPWKNTNPHWYPNEVKFNRSEGLLHFIQNITNGLKTNLRKNKNKF